MLTFIRKNAPWLLAGIAAVTAGVVALVPPDVTLKELVRLVLFHGASTWVNMAGFTVAALVSAAFLLFSAPALYRWSSAVRWVAAPAWGVNTVLGLISAKLNWNTFALGEPRMRMTMFVLFGALILLALHLLVENRRVLAAGDVALAALLWGLAAVTPRVIHPDSPVFRSGWLIRSLFLGQVGLVFLAWAVIVVAIATRPKADAEQTAEPAEEAA